MAVLEDRGSKQRPARWKLSVTGLAVLLLAVLAGWGFRWWSHPDLFGGDQRSGSVVGEPRPVVRSQETYGVVLPSGSGPPTTITFRRPPTMRFAVNTAAATVTFAICHRSPARKVPFIDSARGRGLDLCSRIEPIRAGTTFRFPTMTEYIVATSTPARPGKVVMVQADFDYSLDRQHWCRRGVDHVLLHLVQRVRES